MLKAMRRWFRGWFGPKVHAKKRTPRKPTCKRNVARDEFDSGEPVQRPCGKPAIYRMSLVLGGDEPNIKLYPMTAEVCRECVDELRRGEPEIPLSSLLDMDKAFGPDGVFSADGYTPERSRVELIQLLN